MLTKEEFYNRLWYLNTQGKDIVRGVADDLRGAFGSEQEQPTDERPPQPDGPPTETPEEARRRRESMWGDWAQGAGDMVAKGWNQLASMAPEKTQTPWRSQQMPDRTSSWESRLRYPSKAGSTGTTWNDIAMTDERALEEELARATTPAGMEKRYPDLKGEYASAIQAARRAIPTQVDRWHSNVTRSPEAAGSGQVHDTSMRSDLTAQAETGQQDRDAVDSARTANAQVQDITPETWGEAVQQEQQPRQGPLTWEGEFFEQHGRPPTAYDARVNEEMQAFIRDGRVRGTPTRADWEAVTRSLNRQGIYGPRDVPEFAPGYGRRANEPRAAQPTAASQTQAQSRGMDRYVDEVFPTTWEGLAAGQRAPTSIAQPEKWRAAVDVVNSYLSQEFRVKQGQPHPLEGQAETILRTAEARDLDPTLLLAGVEYVTAQGKTVRTQADLDEVAKRVGQATAANDPKVRQIQQAIKDNYWTKPAGEATGLEQSQQVTPRKLELDRSAFIKYRPWVEDRAQYYGVDPDLVAALIQAESGFNPQAKGRDGEVGLMQIMPATARGLGLTEDSYYHEQSNIDAGTKYLASHLKKYADQGDNAIPLALAAYNAGGARANAYLAGEQALPASTAAYVASIMELYRRLKQENGEYVRR